MKYYNMIKNIIIAGMVVFIVYNYVFPVIPVLTDLLAGAYVCSGVLGILRLLDDKKRAKNRAKREAKEKRAEMTKSA